MILLQSNVNIEPENLWVTIVTILFALSLISERISNLIKLHFTDLRVKRYELGLEKKRELQIMWLAVSCGMLTAFAAGADLFTLIAIGQLINPLDIFDSHKTNVGVKSFLGILFSGFFISMGSKFWHDVLDIVLQFSNLKKYKADQTMTETKFKEDISNETTRMQMIRKTDNILSRLKQMTGFSGYDVIVKDGKVVTQMMFIEKLPPENEQKWINNYYNSDEVEFQQLPSKAGLHADFSR
jgi:hypothetical protein